MIEQLGYRGKLTDRESLTDRLKAAGLGAEAAEAKAEMFARIASEMPAADGPENARPLRAWFVPGRIEFCGKHTDYAGGASVVAAVEQGFCLVGRPRDDRQFAVLDVGLDQHAEFPLDGQLQPTAGHWSNYPMTVARRIARNFPGADRGADVAMASDLPPAAGMSSSSAMIVATFLVLADVNRLHERAEFRENVHDGIDLAGYLATIENGQTFGPLAGDRGVGTFGGSEDHTAILNCRAGHLSEFTYCPVRFVRNVAVPDGFTFAIASSGVVAEKTGSAAEKYNRASALAFKVAQLWRAASGRDDPHLAAALAGRPEAAGRLPEVIRSAGLDDAETEALLGRLEHFIAENEEIRPRQIEAVERGDMAALGEWVDRSQRAAEEFLHNQVPQTVRLAALARQCGAAAATSFGAGFGGSVWALVEKTKIEPFLAAWSDAYAREFPEEAASGRFFATGAGPAAFQVC